MTDFYLRPSSAGRTVTCSGWIGQANTYSLTDEPSDAAKRGTKVHQQIRDQLTEGFHDEDEDTPVVFKAVEFIQEKTAGAISVEFEKELKREWCSGTQDVLDVLGLKGEWFSGTLDVLGLWPDKAMIIDTKTGWHDPPTKSVYWQLLSDSCLLDAKVPTTCYWYNPDRDTFDEIIFSPEDIHEGWLQLLNTKVKSDRAEWWVALKADADACRYCPCLVGCPAARATITEVTEMSENRLLSPESLARDLNAKVVVEKVIKALTKQVHDYLDTGGEIPGWKRIPVRGRRAIKSEWLGGLGSLLESQGLGVTNQEIYEMCSLPHSKLVGLIEDQMEGKTKKEKKAKAEELLVNLDVVAEGQPTRMLKKT